MTLEEILKDCAARGELTHVSVTANPSGKSFTCSYAAASQFGINFATSDCPVEAIREAISTMKLRKRHVEKPNAEKPL